MCTNSKKPLVVSKLPEIVRNRACDSVAFYLLLLKNPSPPSDRTFLALLFPLLRRTCATHHSSQLRIKHGVSPENAAKQQQHTGNEAVAHFLLNRGGDARRTPIHPERDGPSFLSHLSTWNIDASAAIRTLIHRRTLYNTRQFYTEPDTWMHTHPHEARKIQSWRLRVEETFFISFF